MSNAAPSPTNFPFQVWAINGTIHSGHETQEEADAACAQANSKSESLGTTTRFQVRTK